MITPAALAHVPLFASARDGALGPIVARSADIHVVTILVRGQKLSSNMSQYLIDQLAKKRNVFIQYGAECIGVDGTDDTNRSTSHIQTAHF
jgi:hypothetical protein